MSQRVIARRFALALSDSLGSDDALRRTEGELGSFAAAVDQVDELREHLTGPIVPMERKKQTATAVLSALGASDRTRDFVRVLIERHRIGLVSVIAEEFSAAARERLGVVEAAVTSAAPLDEAAQARVREKLTRLARAEVRASFDVDPSLVGGFRARIGSTVYDGTVRGRLERLREQIVKS